MPTDYIFQASGDACGVCSSLDGTHTAAQPHDNCQCQIVPDDDPDCTWDYYGSTSHSGSNQGVFGAEITVTCADGSEIGSSVPIDLGDYTGDPDGIFDYIDDAVADEASALCAECPEPQAPLVA